MVWNSNFGFIKRVFLFVLCYYKTMVTYIIPIWFNIDHALVLHRGTHVISKINTPSRHDGQTPVEQ